MSVMTSAVTSAVSVYKSRPLLEEALKSIPLVNVISKPFSLICTNGTYKAIDKDTNLVLAESKSLSEILEGVAFGSIA